MLNETLVFQGGDRQNHCVLAKTIGLRCVEIPHFDLRLPDTVPNIKNTESEDLT